MDCDNCKVREQRYTFENAMAMAERTIRRLWIVVLVLIVLLVGSNALWVIYENSFQDFYLEQEAQADGNGTIVNANGEVTYYGNDIETDATDSR